MNYYVFIFIFSREQKNKMGRTMCRMVLRGSLLFSVGVFFALVLNLLQVQRNVTLFNPDVLDSLFSSAWWVPPSCGTAAGKIVFYVLHS